MRKGVFIILGLLLVGVFMTGMVRGGCSCKRSGYGSNWVKQDTVCSAYSGWSTGVDYTIIETLNCPDGEGCCYGECIPEDKQCCNRGGLCGSEEKCAYSYEGGVQKKKGCCSEDEKPCKTGVGDEKVDNCIPKSQVCGLSKSCLEMKEPSEAMGEDGISRLCVKKEDCDTKAGYDCLCGMTVSYQVGDLWHTTTKNVQGLCHGNYVVISKTPNKYIQDLKEEGSLGCRDGKVYNASQKNYCGDHCRSNKYNIDKECCCDKDADGRAEEKCERESCGDLRSLAKSMEVEFLNETVKLTLKGGNTYEYEYYNVYRGEVEKDGRIYTITAKYRTSYDWYNKENDSSISVSYPNPNYDPSDRFSFSLPTISLSFHHPCGYLKEDESYTVSNVIGVMYSMMGAPTSVTKQKIKVVDGPCCDPVGSISSVNFNLDKVNLEKRTNGFINVASYDESIILPVEEDKENGGYKTEEFSVITKEDQLQCNVKINLPSEAILEGGSSGKEPTYDMDYIANIFVNISLLSSSSGIDGDYSAKSLMVPLSEFSFLKGKAYYGEFFNGKVGMAHKCSAQIKSKTKPCSKGVVISKNKFIVAKYIYPIVPVNYGDSISTYKYYGNSIDAYKYYTRISNVNDRGIIGENNIGEFVGKRIFTNPLNVNIDAECCYSLFANNKKGRYFWTKKGSCMGLGNYHGISSHGGVVVADSKCYPQFDDSSTRNPYRFYYYEVVSILKREFSKKGITLPNKGSVLSFILDTRDIGRICYKKFTETHMGGGCAVGNIVLLSDPPSSVRTMAHEFGHAIGNANDEYREDFWKRSASQNPVGENGKIQFPKCCGSLNNYCGTKYNCRGMVYKQVPNKKLEDSPFDESAKLNEIYANSIMGNTNQMVRFVYPGNLPCPLRGCYDCKGADVSVC